MAIAAKSKPAQRKRENGLLGLPGLTGISRASLKNLDDKSRKVFGKRLEALMTERGLSQIQLAEKTFGKKKGNVLGRDRISKYINGTQFPEFMALQKLALALEVELIGGLLPVEILEALSRATAATTIDVRLMPRDKAHVNFSGTFPHAFVTRVMALIKEFDAEFPDFSTQE